MTWLCGRTIIGTKNGKFIIKYSYSIAGLVSWIEDHLKRENQK